MVIFHKSCSTSMGCASVHQSCFSACSCHVDMAIDCADIAPAGHCRTPRKNVASFVRDGENAQMVKKNRNMIGKIYVLCIYIYYIYIKKQRFATLPQLRSTDPRFSWLIFKAAEAASSVPAVCQAVDEAGGYQGYIVEGKTISKNH